MYSSKSRCSILRHYLNILLYHAMSRRSCPALFHYTCGYTDMRKSIDGLAAIVKQVFRLDPCARNLYLFCGKLSDRIKALYWEGDGFLLLYKRLEGGRFQWPRQESEALLITPRQLRAAGGLPIPIAAGKADEIGLECGWLNPFEYLVYIFRNAPGWDIRRDAAALERLFPFGREKA